MDITGILSLAWCVTFFMCALYFYREQYRLNKKIAYLISKQAKELEIAREEAVAKSKEVIRGKVTEEIVPVLPGFKYTLSDTKFMGNPIDYIVFDRMSNIRDTRNGEITIVLADVKTGKAGLTKVQRAIKDAVDNNRVRFEIWEVGNDNELRTK